MVRTRRCGAVTCRPCCRAPETTAWPSCGDALRRCSRLHGATEEPSGSERAGIGIYDPDRCPLRRGLRCALAGDRSRQGDLDRSRRTHEGWPRASRAAVEARAGDSARTARRRLFDDGFVFPGQKFGKPLSSNAMDALLQERMKLPQFTVHGFRSCFKDWATDETHHQREIIEAALAHVVGDNAERAYRRTDAT